MIKFLIIYKLSLRSSKRSQNSNSEQ